jgi:hypothetical protein
VWKIFRTLRFTRALRPWKVELAVCAIFRNEADYLDEWLDFHTKNGVKRFFLINHKSDDNYRSVLAPWIEKGIVDLVDAESDNQVIEYNRVLKMVRLKVKWLAFIDIDEFLFSPTNEPLSRVLRRFRGVAAVFVHWRLFGSNSLISPPGGAGVVSSFRRCLEPATSLAQLSSQTALHREIRGATFLTGSPNQGKCIIRPKKVHRMGIHWPAKFDGFVTNERKEASRIHFPALDPPVLPSMELLRINHYWSRSLSELRLKHAGSPFDLETLRRVPDKHLPGEAQEKWERHLNKSLDHAALVNIGLEPPMVIFLGDININFQNSIGPLLNNVGSRVLLVEPDDLSASIRNNFERGERLLSGYEEEHVFPVFGRPDRYGFDDMEGLLGELHSNYPSANFVLVNSDKRTSFFLDLLRGFCSDMRSNYHYPGTLKSNAEITLRAGKLNPIAIQTKSVHPAFANVLKIHRLDSLGRRKLARFIRVQKL